jgi:hypothetical protein
MGDKTRKSRTDFICAVAVFAMVAGLAAPAVAAKPSGIGVTSIVVRDVEGKTEEIIRQLVLRDSVYQNEIVQTGMESASELKFTDETRVSVGPNSTIVLDEFVYDPDPGEGTFALQVTEGVFRFFSGNMASSNYKIESPTVTVGVRGTVLVMVTRRDGAVAVIMESDDGVEVTNNNGDTVLLDTPGMATVAFTDGTMTPQGNPPAWALWRIQNMDNVLATAGLPAAPPVKPGPPGSPEPTEPPVVQTAAAPPPPPPPPGPGPTVTEVPPKRGLPRAAYAHGEEAVPTGGFAHANDNALQPNPPGGGAGASDEGGPDPLLISGGGETQSAQAAVNGSQGNNGANNNGNSNGNGKSGSAGSNGNAGGNGNGKGKN